MLSQWFSRELALGSVVEMEQEIDRDLLRDMGLPCRRTHNLVAEYFTPYWPERYRDVGKERHQARVRA